MKYWMCIVALASMLGLPSSTFATSLSGILIYSTQDESGTPVCWDWEAEVVTTNGQLWRTLVHPHWFGLGVLSGLPVQSLREDMLLNSPDFSIATPLVEGENDFTILGEPGPLTESDTYERFALNLYFDGINDRPGISVLFRPRTSIVEGVPPQPNRSEINLSLGVNARLMSADSIYDDGIFKVSVTAVSFGEPRAWSVDMVGSQTMQGNGTSDWGGIIRLMVEPSDNPSAQPIRGPGSQGFGVVPGGMPGGVGSPGGGVPGVGGAPGGSMPFAGPGRELDVAPEIGGTHGAQGQAGWHRGDDEIGDDVDAATPEPTPDAEELPGAQGQAGLHRGDDEIEDDVDAATPEPMPDAEETPGPDTTMTPTITTPVPTNGTPSPTAATTETTTPVATAPEVTPTASPLTTAAATFSPSAATPTPRKPQ